VKSTISIVSADTSRIPELFKMIQQVTDDSYEALQINPENYSKINNNNSNIIVFVFEQWNESASLIFFKLKSLFPNKKTMCVFEKSDSEHLKFDGIKLRSKVIYADKLNFNYQFMDNIINLIELTETEEKTIAIAKELKATKTKMKYYALTTFTILLIILILNFLIL
jgi:hypothetical protein